MNWLKVGSKPKFKTLCATNASPCPSMEKVCKTFIRRFDSDPRLQHNRQLPHPFQLTTHWQRLLARIARCGVLPLLAYSFWINLGSLLARGEARCVQESRL